MAKYDQLIFAAADRYGLDPQLLLKQFTVESGLNPNATSPVGARGLAQVMPNTAKGMGYDPESLYDPSISVDAGAKYMSQKLAEVKKMNPSLAGDALHRAALAAYNAGAGGAGKYIRSGDESKLPAETRGYLSKIMGGNMPSKSSKNERYTQEYINEVIARYAPKKQAAPQAAANSGDQISVEYIDNIIAERQKANAPKPPSMLDKIANAPANYARFINETVQLPFNEAAGILETGTTIGSGAVAPVLGWAGALSGKAAAATQGKDYNAKQRAEDITASLTYAPKGNEAKRNLQGIAKGVQYVDDLSRDLTGKNLEQNIQSFGPISAPFQGMANAVKPLIAAQTAIKAANVAQKVAPIVQKVGDVGKAATAAVGGSMARVLEKKAAATAKNTQAGSVGAAVTPAEMRNAQLAQKFDQQLTGGQISQDFEMQRMEGEQFKANTVGGEKLRNLGDEQNLKLARTLESMSEEFNPMATDQYNLGERIQRGVSAAEKASKSAVKSEYDKLKASGELDTPVAIDALDEYLTANRTNQGAAPILKDIENELMRLKSLAPEEGGVGDGRLTIGQIESLRSRVGKNANFATPDAVYAPEIKRMIDDVLDTEAAGVSEMYKGARAAYKQHVDAFKNRALVRNLLTTKRNSNDRMIAMENVLDTVVGSKSKRDDVVHLMSTLKAGGEDGAQAINELRAGLIEKLREVGYSNVTSATADNLPSISTAKVVKYVRDLDEGGKLDVIMGKKNAENLRDFADLVQIMNVKRAGAINQSNTGSILTPFIEAAVSGMTFGVPFPAVTAMREAVKMKNARALERAVESSLRRQNQILEQVNKF